MVKSQSRQLAAVPKLKATKKAAQGTKKKYTDEEIQLICPKLECGECDQDSHSFEKDLLPKKVRVRWHKFNPNETAKGGKVATGRECYNCFLTRRRFFVEDLGAMIALMKTKPDLKNRFGELRKDKLTGEDKFKNEARVQANTYVKQSDAKFYETFTEGGFYSLAKFCRMKGVTAPHTSKLKAAAKKEFPSFRFGMGDQGKYGVWWPNDPKPHMADYRYREGNDRRMTKEDVKKFGNEDEDMAAEEFKDGVPRRGSSGRKRADDGSDGDSGSADDEDEEADEEDTEDDEDEEAPSDAGSGFDSRPARQGTKPLSGPTPKGLKASSASGRAPRAGGGRGRKRRGDDDDDGAEEHLAHGGGEESEGADVCDGVQRPTWLKTLIQRSNTLLKTVRAVLSPSSQWKTCLRKRRYDSFHTRLGTSARKLSAAIGDQKAVDLGEAIFRESHLIADRRNAFHLAKNTPKALLVEESGKKVGLTSRDVEMWQSFDTTLASSVVQHVALGMCDSADLPLMLRVAQYKKGELNVSLIDTASAIDADAAHSAVSADTLQKQLVQYFIDKVMTVPAADFTNIMRQAASQVDFKVRATRAAEGEGQYRAKEHPAGDGWSWQTELDLSILFVACRILDDPGAVVGGLRNEVAIAFHNLKFCSTRVSAYAAAKSRNCNNAVYEAFESMRQRFGQEGPPNRENLANVSQQLKGDMERAVHALEVACGRAEAETDPSKSREIVYDAVEQLAETEDSDGKIRAFVDTCVRSEPGDLEKDLMDSSVALGGRFLKCMCMVLTEVVVKKDYLKKEAGLISLGRAVEGRKLAICLDKFKWCSQALDLTKDFLIGSVEMENAVQVTEFLVNFGEANEAAKEKHPPEALRIYAGIWGQQGALRRKLAAPAKSPWVKMRMEEEAGIVAVAEAFATELGQHSSEEAIAEFVKSLVIQSGDKDGLSKVLTVGEELGGCLPPICAELFTSAKSAREMQAAAGRMREGHVYGIMELNRLMIRVSAVDPVIVGAWIGYDADRERVIEAWRSKFQNTLQFFETEPLAKFTKRHSGLNDAIGKWSFTGELAYLKKKDPDTAEAADMRMAEQFAVDFDIKWSHLESMLMNFDKMTWMSSDERTKLQVFRAENAKAGFEETATHAKVLLATISAISIELTADSKGKRTSFTSLKTYMKDTLRLDVEMLPPKVAGLISAEATASAPPASEAATAAHPTSPSSQAPPGSNGGSNRKKRRLAEQRSLSM